MSAHCFIEGQEVALHTVAKRVMNFGQAVAHQRALAYALRVGRSAFEQRLRAAHAQTLEELRVDAEQGDEDEITAGLRALSWPELDALIASDFALFRAYLETYLVGCALDAFASAPALSAVYQLDSLDEVTLDGGQLILRGRCYASNSHV